MSLKDSEKKKTLLKVKRLFDFQVSESKWLLLYRLHLESHIHVKVETSMYFYSAYDMEIGRYWILTHISNFFHIKIMVHGYNDIKTRLR